MRDTGGSGGGVARAEARRRAARALGGRGSALGGMGRSGACLRHGGARGTACSGRAWTGAGGGTPAAAPPPLPWTAAAMALGGPGPDDECRTVG